MEHVIGRHMWVIADGYIPTHSTCPAPEMTSHESACILNANDTDAEIELLFYYADREPVGPYKLRVTARRALHQRFNDLADPSRLPTGTDYCCLITSTAPIVVQHTRLDTRQAANSVMSTIAYPVDAP
jgi:hypothetical protein